MSKLFQSPTLRLTPSWTDAKKTTLVKDAHGLVAFRLALWVGGKEIAHMAVVSGQAYNQELMLCTSRVAGCGAPIGEGVYRLGDPDATRRVNWASGVVGDYSASFKAGLGPIWTGIHATPEYPCSTSDFGIHADWNADDGMPGTLGCTGLPTPGQSTAALKTYVSWQDAHDIDFYVVDHGYGTVPKPPKASINGQPAKVEIVTPPTYHYTKLYANENGIQAYRDNLPARAMSARLDLHDGKIGVAINGSQIPPERIHSVQLIVTTK